jgi:hypothetical protein
LELSLCYHWSPRVLLLRKLHPTQRVLLKQPLPTAVLLSGRPVERPRERQEIGLDSTVPNVPRTVPLRSHIPANVRLAKGLHFPVRPEELDHSPELGLVLPLCPRLLIAVVRTVEVAALQGCRGEASTLSRSIRASGGSIVEVTNAVAPS